MFLSHYLIEILNVTLNDVQSDLNNILPLITKLFHTESCWQMYCNFLNRCNFNIKATFWSIWPIKSNTMSTFFELMQHQHQHECLFLINEHMANDPPRATYCFLTDTASNIKANGFTNELLSAFLLDCDAMSTSRLMMVQTQVTVDTIEKAPNLIYAWLLCSHCHHVRGWYQFNCSTVTLLL